MKTLYFDCFAGASGDMILGALVAAGVDPDRLRAQLSLLGVEGFSVSFETVNKSGLSANYARVETAHEHKHRHLSDIRKIIDDSQLSDDVKQRSIAIFTRLAEAEARVHNEPIEHVHFHEVGALDAIVDVVGAAICFEMLAIERFVCSPIHVGSGTVEMAHGRFPVPPPAVAELLKGVPFYSTDLKGELLTPTGAAIITTVCKDFGPIPQLRLEGTGYGAGTRDYENFPNVLRVMIGESDASDQTEQTLWMLETNVDDVSPQIIGHVMDRAFTLGARDCYFTPIQMKKNRPGVLLSILCDPEKKTAMTDLLFMETTTIGVRSYQVNRRALDRQIVRVETFYGPIDVKVARLNGRVVNAMPEFDQCRQAAERKGVALREVEDAARLAFRMSGQEV
ncbi:MAG TPA: nickel pincer cofactor biosynthesis protein LarC [Pyrinomonadaceae bacterium]|jgi:TIGR00299 family protein|nr:nickel pincer cofactor biosynthesis protein LarC [Pyrinomonadaceae bacterium]